ncbi:MFS general substrate transporter [Leucogyrophana mollusca]|uniref:MFS general substrate transporter n=1 Tax=Leucogyrophana mollusca TaxID=85980 RepID=A0ACB8B447_9AGAM|nr:MFS general substrate transporter [Leucogyrophana mollusca]
MSHLSNERFSTRSVSDPALQDVIEHRKGLRGVYYHPVSQIVLLGFVCFLLPGMFNALTGLGGGGQIDATTSANSNAALYSTGSAVAFFAGSVHNKLGPKRTLQLGALGYPLMFGSYLAISIHPGAGGFVVVAGVLLGISAAFLWTAQGSIMLSYATEAQKGIFISIFWAIFNLGAVVGSAVSFAQNFHRTNNNVGNGTYVGFLVLSLIGLVVPAFMVDPEKTRMVRTDGTTVVAVRQPSWKAELLGLWVALQTDPMIVLLFPMFFASNYFYTWQFNDYNAALFNIRARALNNLVYWVAQIFGSILTGVLLDRNRLSRRRRAFIGWLALLVMLMAVHLWAYFYQRTYTRQSILPNAQKMDIYDTGYIAHCWLMVFYGLFDAMWQTTAYWLMGAMSNDPAKLAVFVGFYKSLQCAGAAGVWRADGVGVPYMNIFASTWALTASGLAFAFPMVYLRVKDYTDGDDQTR